jgi:hypothetical protein
MTFDDDFLMLHTESGIRRPTCRSLGIEWPPPETLDILGFRWTQSRRSEITDEHRSAMTHVCRGAEYFPSQRDGDGK